MKILPIDVFKSRGPNLAQNLDQASRARANDLIIRMGGDEPPSWRRAGIHRLRIAD
jgi:hypothetical protein